ncbi:MAG TPA: hypothetical protein VGB62_09395 [Allosphingosinicella sp.]|jgi:hypothetical protein
MTGDEIKYHSDRAMTELDLAVRSENTSAARAHLALSALHLDRMRKLSQLSQRHVAESIAAGAAA